MTAPFLIAAHVTESRALGPFTSAAEACEYIADMYPTTQWHWRILPVTGPTLSVPMLTARLRASGLAPNCDAEPARPPAPDKRELVMAIADISEEYAESAEWLASRIRDNWERA